MKKQRFGLAWFAAAVVAASNHCGGGGDESDGADGPSAGSTGAGGSTGTAGNFGFGGGFGTQAACGDGVLAAQEGRESCDDGNVKAGDGCSAACQVEPGWLCTSQGVPCQPVSACGDGVVGGNERCDDGNASPGDGCNETCQFEEGFACDAPGVPCRATTCNDGTKEGTEACDDGNNDMGDGCSPACAVEPSCPPDGGACGSACGDGLHFTGDPEECEDGNNVDGDGCSKDCKVEPGFQCAFAAGGEPERLELPLVLRDFKMGWNRAGENDPQDPQPGGHPDFEKNAFSKAGFELGVVKDKLGADGKPAYAHGDGGSKTTTGKAAFDQWYRDDASINQTLLQTMTLERIGGGAYQFKRDVDANQFYPLDGLAFGNQGQGHNYHFTSEVRYWFEYKGGEKLEFTGDDDVWVFINKRLVIDLGGVHGQERGTVTLEGGKGKVTQKDVQGVKTVELGLEAGKVYEAVVWQAERHTTRSNYTLTLSGFVSSTSTCQSVCGDGIVTPDEACDDGPGGNAGGYGECNPGCKSRGPYCGDGVVQSDAGETCDDGNAVNGDGCNANCATPAPR